MGQCWSFITQFGTSNAIPVEAPLSPNATVDEGEAARVGTNTVVDDDEGAQSGTINAAVDQLGTANAEVTQAITLNSAGDEVGTSTGFRAGAARNIIQFRIKDLRIATRNFSKYENINHGRTSDIFIGTLSRITTSDCNLSKKLLKQTVAVKRLSRYNYEDRNADYDREVRLLSRLNHPHIIDMVGCCAFMDKERIIVYELMPLRNLNDWLHDRIAGEEPLTWRTRMAIGAGIAKGLRYLHNEANPRVIFRDLRPRKIVLGEGHHPKICGFRSALSVPSDAQSSTVTTNILIGPYPFRAPEVTSTNHAITFKADVFSFGVLLREIISGHAHIDPNWLKNEDNLDLEPDQDIDDHLLPLEDELKALTLIHHCVQRRPDLRPDMIVVDQAMRYLAHEENAKWPADSIESLFKHDIV